MGQEYRSSTRIYASKDPNIQQFSLRLTDEDGNLIQFNSDYLLTLAIFFTPQDS
jgi:hypothetical protein